MKPTHKKTTATKAKPRAKPAQATTAPSLPPDPNRLLRVEDVADRLNISTITAYRLTKSGKLPAVKIGHNVRIKPADLEAFLNASTVEQKPPEG